jgi:hypothetical protein
MMSITKTPFSSQCYILVTIWAYYRNEGEFFETYTDLYDITLPIARAISQAYLDADMLPDYVESDISGAWDVLLNALEVTDTGFDTLEQIFEASPLVEVKE